MINKSTPYILVKDGNNTDIEGQCVAVFAMPEPPKEDADNG